MADVIETPVVDAPTSIDFETYVQTRQAEMTAPAAEDIEDTPSEAPADPAPATEETPEGEATPAQETAKPDDATGAPTESTPEDKGKKKDGIPQSRLDEVTKARREAERERDALKAKAEQLERDLEAARKPADKPADPAPVETKPEIKVDDQPRPKMPKLDDPEIDGDFDKLQENLEAYHEKLADWKYEQRSRAEKKQAEDARVAKEVADKTAAEKAKTENLQSDFLTRINSAKEKHSDWDEVMNRTNEKPLYSPAMSAAIRGFDDPGEIAYFLASNPEESQKIAELTAHKDGLAPEEYQRLLVVASRELSKVESKLGEIPALESKPVEAATPAPAKPTPVPPKQKPLASSAPKPPTPVTPTNTNPPNTKEAMSLEDYEKARQPQLERRNRR